MKKQIAFLLAAVWALGLAGCSDSGTDSRQDLPSEAVSSAAEGLEEPPVLTVTCGEASVTGLLGTYSWQRENEDGTVTIIEADGLHPLDCEDLLTPLETTEPTAILSFTEAADAILSVQCWSDADWADPSAESQEVAVDGDTIQLLSGGQIYVVVAQWDAEGGSGGTASYAFYLIAE